MPYKIVETIERGKATLVAVPRLWERDGILYWPTKSFKKYHTNESSEPEGDWQTKDCILKRDYLTSLQKAQAKIVEMCANSDSESDSEPEIVCTRDDQLAKRSKINAHMNYDDDDGSKDPKRLSNFNSIKDLPTSSLRYFTRPESGGSSSGPSPKRRAITVFEGSQTSVEAQAVKDSQVLSILSREVLPKIEGLSEDITSIMTKVVASLSTMNENQQLLVRNQNEILSKISDIQKKIEELSKQRVLSEKRDLCLDTSVTPISNLKEFKEFENLVSNPEVRCDLTKRLSILCNRGQGKAVNNGYVLIDVLFDRHFLTECSWSGGSKSDKVKICFKSFTNTIKFFFNVLHSLDDTFSYFECQEFIKVVLRNSVQRLNSKNLRLSAKKNRPKKIKITASQSIDLMEGQLDEAQSAAILEIVDMKPSIDPLDDVA